jgi:hypothetical protein
MPGDLKWKADAITTLLSTELNALGSGGTGSALGTAYNNASSLNLWGDFWLSVTFGVAPTADTTVDLYIVPATDGSNYNDGGTSTQPVNFYRGSWSLRAVTAHSLTIHGVMLPPVPFKIFIVNGSNQAFPGSGSTVQMVGYREQYT